MKDYLLVLPAIFLLTANAAAQQDQATSRSSDKKAGASVVGKKTTGSANIARNLLIVRADEYLGAVIAQDVEAIYKFMSSKHIESLGGKDGAIEMINYEFGIWKEGTLEIVSMKIKPESKNQKSNVSPQKIKISVTVKAGDDTATFDGELTAVAKGNKWFFVNEVTIMESLGVKEFEDSEEPAVEK